MPKKQGTKKRTEVKDLSKKEEKLGEKEMKKVKGGTSVQFNPKEFKLDEKANWKPGGK